MIREGVIVKGTYIRMLKALCESHRSMYITEIAKKSNITFSSAVKIIREMLEKGLVKKEKITRKERKSRGNAIGNFWKETDLGKRLMLIFQEIEVKNEILQR